MKILMMMSKRRENRLSTKIEDLPEVPAPRDGPIDI